MTRELSEGPLLAASRNAAASSTRTTSAASPTSATSSTLAPRRISFAKIAEPLEVPELLALQTSSFSWLLGDDAWKARTDEALAAGRPDVSRKFGLEEIFEEISPIEDFSETMSLSFAEPRFEPPKYSVDECKDKDFTYAAPLFVTAEFMNNETGEIKSQTVFMGDFPLMSDKGTFIINGTERVVVSQLVRSPGVYFERSADKTSDKDIYTAKIIPSRGAWLEFEVDKRDMVGVRLDRKRKQNVTVLLKALGWTEAQILEEFGQYESIRQTLEKDHTSGQDDALLDIYRKLRPGEPPTREAAQTLLDNYYFNPKRYDLAKVGRHKINKKLGLQAPFDQQTLTVDDIVAAIRYIVALHDGSSTELQSGDGQTLHDADGNPVVIEADDIDHFGNRRMRTVGELIQNQLRTGLARMERVVRERMTTQDVEAITPQTLINIRPVVAALKEFFGTSQLSQFMDQTNPIAGLTHKRRLSALGPGGLSRERAGYEVRDVHTSHYGRMCPIETPEGPNIGLIGSLSTYGRINAFGFVETPYRRVVKARVTDDIDYLTASEEDRFVIAQANALIDDKGAFTDDQVLVRQRDGEVGLVPGANVDYMDVSPRQMVSVATALIPFLEHDDANRALMGSNMQRQAVPLIRNSAPLVGTGMEFRAAVDAGDVVVAEQAGVVREVSADLVEVLQDDGTVRSYRLAKFRRSNQGTCINQRPLVVEGARLEKGQPIADGPCTDEGEMALGTNLLVAFMPWHGHNYEDAIILSQRLVQEDVLTSIHIEEHEVDARDTKLGPGGDHPRHPERQRGDARRPRRARDHPHRRRGRQRRHPRRQGHAQGRDRADARGAAAARDLRREGARGARHVAEGSPRRDRHRHRRPGLRPRGRRRAAARCQPAGPCLRRPEAQDLRRRQAGRTSRQQGRHLQDPAGRGHAVHGGRHPGRHHPQPARRAGPHEHRPGARDPPRVGGQGRLEGRGRQAGVAAAAPLASAPPSPPPTATSPPRCSTVPRRTRSPGCSRRPCPTATASAWSAATARPCCSTVAAASCCPTRWRWATCTCSSSTTSSTTRSTPARPARTR